VSELHLVNPATAAVSDCGWSFFDGRMTEVPRHRPGDTPDDRHRGWITALVLDAAMQLIR
jgi:hypothetical protein